MKLRAEELYKELSIKHNVPVSTVKSIIDSQFTTIRKQISYAEANDINSFSIIQVTHLGKFVPSQRKIDTILSRKKRKDDSRK